jgi:hypothetical protein
MARSRDPANLEENVQLKSEENKFSNPLNQLLNYKNSDPIYFELYNFFSRRPLIIRE